MLTSCRSFDADVALVFVLMFVSQSAPMPFCDNAGDCSLHGAMLNLCFSFESVEPRHQLAHPKVTKRCGQLLVLTFDALCLYVCHRACEYHARVHHGTCALYAEARDKLNCVPFGRPVSSGPCLFAMWLCQRDGLGWPSSIVHRFGGACNSGTFVQDSQSDFWEPGGHR